MPLVMIIKFLPVKITTWIITANCINWIRNIRIIQKWQRQLLGETEITGFTCLLSTTGNGLVGIVSEVGDHYAKVRAIIDDKSNVSAMFENTGETCIVKGNMESIYKGYIDVTMISNNVTAKNGDSVVTSHISDKFLPGLLVGYISDITQEADGLSKSGHLTPVVSFDKLETVLIITTLKVSSEIEDVKN